MRPTSAPEFFDQPDSLPHSNFTEQTRNHGMYCCTQICQPPPDAQQAPPHLPDELLVKILEIYVAAETNDPEVPIHYRYQLAAAPFAKSMKLTRMFSDAFFADTVLSVCLPTTDRIPAKFKFGIPLTLAQNFSFGILTRVGRLQICMVIPWQTDCFIEKPAWKQQMDFLRDPRKVFPCLKGMTVVLRVTVFGVENLWELGKIPEIVALLATLDLPEIAVETDSAVGGESGKRLAMKVGDGDLPAVAKELKTDLKEYKIVYETPWELAQLGHVGGTRFVFAGKL